MSDGNSPRGNMLLSQRTGLALPSHKHCVQQVHSVWTVDTVKDSIPLEARGGHTFFAKGQKISI